MKSIFKIDGMHCASCKTLIEDVASEVPGVVSCEADAAQGKAVVEHTENFEAAEFIAAVAQLDAGYTARLV